MIKKTWKGNFLMRSSVDFWYRLISLRPNVQLCDLLLSIKCTLPWEPLCLLCTSSFFSHQAEWQLLLPFASWTICWQFSPRQPRGKNLVGTARSDLIQIFCTMSRCNKRCSNHLPRCFPPCGLPCSLLHTCHVPSPGSTPTVDCFLETQNVLSMDYSSPKNRKLVRSHWSGQVILGSQL